MDNQHRKITGYRELGEQEIANMNRVKEMGEQLGLLLSNLEAQNGIDLRWTSIARTDLQKGIMSLTRAIARPESF